MNDVTSVVLFLIGLLAVGLTGLVVVEVIPRWQKLWKPFKDAYPLEAAFLEAQAGIAVDAAEEEIGGGQGTLKFDLAMEYVKTQAKRYGYTFDERAVKTMVLAKVRVLKERANAVLKSK